jgi:hypothetical protein
MAHTRQYDLTTGTASQIGNLTKYSLFTLICEGILEQPDGTIEQPKQKGKRTNRDLACPRRHMRKGVSMFSLL